MGRLTGNSASGSSSGGGGRLTGTLTPPAAPSVPLSQTIWDFAKNLPTAIIRGVAGVPAELVGQVGTKIGDVTANAFNKTSVGKATGSLLRTALGVTPEEAKKIKAEYEKPVTLPWQSTPLIDATSPKTGKQILGTAAEAALNTALLYTTAGGYVAAKAAAKTAAEQALKTGGEQVLKTAAEQIGTKTSGRILAKTILKDAGIGGSYGAAVGLQQKDATAKDVAISTAGGVAAGVLLPPVIGTALKGLFAGTGIISKGVAGLVEKTASNLESKAAPAAGELTRLALAREISASTADHALETRNGITAETASKIANDVADNVEKTFSNKAAATAIREAGAKEGGFATADELVNHLYQASESNASKRLYEVPAETALTRGQKLAGNVAGGLRYLQDVPARARTALLDKLNPVRIFAQQAKDAGIDIPAGDLEEFVRNAPNRGAGMAADDLHQYTTLTKRYQDVWPQVKEYSKYLDAADRLQNGGKIEGGATATQIASGIAELGLEVGPEKFARIQEAQKQSNDFLRAYIPTLVDSGRLSEEQAQKILAAHPNYIPHDVLDYLDLQGSKPIEGTGASYNMTKNGLSKAQGSTRAIADQDQATVRYIYRQNVLNQKNKAMSAIVDAGQQLGPHGGFVPLRTAENVKQQIELAAQVSNFVKERTSAQEDLSVLSKTAKDLYRKADKASAEMAALADEAQTRASEQEAPSAITAVLDKALAREQKIYQLQGELATNKSAAGELSSLVDEHNGAIKQLRSALDEVRDTKLKTVDIPKGFEKVSYFKDGIREDWLVPADIGLALKNLDPEQASAAMQWLRTSIAGKIATSGARAVRAVSTGLSPVFGLFTNPIRDIQTVQLTEKAGIKDLATGLITELTGKEDNELYRQALREGAFQGTIYRESQDPEQILMKKLQQGNIFQKLSRPDKLVEDASQAMEEMTRLAVFKRAIADGATPQEAAKAARNATVDFGRSGSFTQVVNQVVPFLNARIQGFSNILTAATKDPTKFVRQSLWTAAMPTALLTSHNINYKSYENVPDDEKRKYWIVMTGESKSQDYQGHPILIPHYIKIPKGEAQQAMSNVLERVMTLSRQKYPDSTATFMGKLVKDFSPVNDSSILPPAVQMLAELKSNYSWFRDAPIVPDYVKIGKKWYKSSDVPAEYRYRQNSSELSKALGSALGWSPAKIDYVLKTGVLNDIIRTGDLITNGPQAGSNDTFDKAAQLPFVRSVIGTSSYGEQEQKKASDAQKLMDKNVKKIQRSSVKTVAPVSTGGGRATK